MLGLGLGINKFVINSGIDVDAQTIYNRIIADGGVSNLARLNFFVKGLKTIYGSLANVPVCYDAHWIGYKLGSGTGATAGQAAAKLYSLTVAADAVQSTAASQPLLLAHTGENYWWQVPSLPANNCQTPYQASYNLTSYCDIRVKVDLNINATGFPDYPFLFGWNNYNGLAINNNGTLFFFINGSGTATTAATISRTYSGWLRVVKNVGVYTYYTSTDGITYTLFETLNGSTSNLSVANQPLIVGSSNNDARSCAMVKYYRCQLYSSTTLLADFNPASYNPSVSQTQWSSATGEVWSISTGTATTGYKGVLVDRTTVQGDGVDDSMETANSVWGSVSSVYSAIKFINLNTKLGTSVDSNLANIAIQKYEGIDAVNNYFVFQGGININTNVSSRNNLNTLYNSVRNGSSSALNFNNGTSTRGTLNTAISTGVRILANRGNTATLFTNGNLNTILISGSADNSTTRTATYNLIRSLNNNAF